MFFTAILILFAAQPEATAKPPAEPPQPPAPTTADEAITRLAVYDAKVRALDWASRVSSPNAKCPPPLSTCRGVLGEDRRYRVIVEMTGVAPDGNCGTDDSDTNFDGAVIITVTHRQKTWLRRGEQFDLWLSHGPPSLLGRGGASQRPVNASEQLRGGWHQTPERRPNGDVSVSALVERQGTVDLIRVTMRPSLQMALVQIETMAPVFQYASKVITASEWTTLNGVALPTKGSVEAFSVALTEDQAVAIQAAAKKRGLSNIKAWWPTEPAKLALAREALAEGLKGEKVQVRPSALGHYDVTVTYNALNEKVVVPPPPKPIERYTFADELTGEVVLPGSPKTSP